MNIEDVRDYSLSLPMATEDFPFDDVTLVFRVMGKIFVLLSLDASGFFAVKCDPDYAIELRERHSEIQPAFHMNKRHWNQIDLTGSLPDDLIRSLISHSYDQVVKKLPRRLTAQHPEILEKRQK